MKRHPSLVHLSREHHGALILARLLQKDAPAYKGLPSDTDGKAVYALKFYQEDLIKHFEEEEKILPFVKGINTGLDLLIGAILDEHRQLHISFRAIKYNTDLPGHLDTLGKALELHVRKEERQLFPLIQESCSEDLMAEIGRSLSNSQN